MQESIPLQSWNMWAQYVAYGLAGIAVLIVLGHVLKLFITRDFKSKYDYINANEINLLWFASIAVISAVAFYANAFMQEISILWIFVRAFVTISMGLIIGVIVQNSLKFYYPFYVEKRLKKLRYRPRISPKSGKPMKLLSEEEEDVYLDEGMQAEEDVFSIDYDVWIDEDTGYTKIEKYSGHLHANQCPECNYQTMRVIKEELLKSPTNDEEGELEKYFNCGYCGYKTRKTVKVAKLQSATSEEAHV
ncbi:MAG: hypothetical protein OEX02_17010 [Cyclobacteriaceae bacterium]|nr:hypothetical protein [Cyclobacteriaceae bacterium]